jgi:polysaccharide deacetylase family protein (PEP-CTERM system associated)
MKGKKDTKVKNVLQIDVEDWYCDLDSSCWGQYEDRVASSTYKILDILKENAASATFFILGYVAEKHPELVRQIKREGHEIGTHGYRHLHLSHQSPEQFSDDLNQSIKVLKDITGDRILGHRACQFSLIESTRWAIRILKQAGLRYDSSIFPVKTHLYGVPNAPRFAYRISDEKIDTENPGENFWEIPLAVLKLPFINKNIPIAGGFYLRLFPYELIRYAIKKINSINGQPAVCYLHPWELDPLQPRISNLPWYHYFRLQTVENKLRKLLKDFQWGSTREVFNFEY